jgi:hypothetical protein
VTDEYVITLRDVFGITVGGSNYKVASGNFVDLQVTSQSYGFGNSLDQRSAALKVIETNSLAEDGTSSSVASTNLTDSTKNWSTNQWANYTLKDSAAATFTISSNTATALTLSAGTPASGDYQILAPKTAFNDRKERVQSPGLNNPTIDLDFSFDLYNTLANATVNGNTVAGLTFKILWDFLTIPNVYFLKDYLGSTTTIKTPINSLINNPEIFNTTNPKVYTSDGMPVKIVSAQITRESKTENYGAIVSGRLKLVETRI